MSAYLEQRMSNICDGGKLCVYQLFALAVLVLFLTPVVYFVAPVFDNIIWKIFIGLLLAALVLLSLIMFGIARTLLFISLFAVGKFFGESIDSFLVLHQADQSSTNIFFDVYGSVVKYDVLIFMVGPLIYLFHTYKAMVKVIAIIDSQPPPDPPPPPIKTWAEVYAKAKNRAEVLEDTKRADQSLRELELQKEQLADNGEIKNE